ncbi:hypothetical protein GHT09_001319 [Marmota monax]|uniref:Uncharacterized protein n=1 Tax=Marmota monax TaxID=9995 RepID=A0A834PV98_MARMO|nr:hypothetical protein GHT09_001319 [Marmota monax]
MCPTPGEVHGSVLPSPPPWGLFSPRPVWAFSGSAPRVQFSLGLSWPGRWVLQDNLATQVPWAPRDCHRLLLSERFGLGLCQAGGVVPCMPDCSPLAAWSVPLCLAASLCARWVGGSLLSTEGHSGRWGGHCGPVSPPPAISLGALDLQVPVWVPAAVSTPPISAVTGRAAG